MPRIGKRPVGVARQRVGPARRQINCQLIVGLAAGRQSAFVPLALRLYLPKDWARDRARRAAAGVPPGVEYLARWEVGFDLVAAAWERVRPGTPGPSAVVADATYGHVPAFRTMLASRSIPYVLEVPPLSLVRPGGRAAPVAWAAEQLVLAVEPAAAAHHQDRRFLAWRVHPAAATDGAGTLRPLEWLLAEWPGGHPRPARFWLSTLGPRTPVGDLARLAACVDRAGPVGQDLLRRTGLDAAPGILWADLDRDLAAILKDGRTRKEAALAARR